MKDHLADAGAFSVRLAISVLIAFGTMGVIAWVR